MFSNESARKRRLKVNNTILPTAGSIMDPAANHYRVCDYLALTDFLAHWPKIGPKSERELCKNSPKN